MPKVSHILFVIALCMAMVGCYPPQVQYATTKMVAQRRDVLCANLLELLPTEQRRSREAQIEARWLADTAYKAAAGISRVNGSHFPGWAGNALINSRIQDRGLCWHYQHDMYRELRRRKLHFFRLGCCVRDFKERTEHNCVYVAAAKGKWPHVWVLDAWMWNGRLKVSRGTALEADRWGDLPAVCRLLAAYYEEGHRWPVEHWLVLRGVDGTYDIFNTPNAVNSSQYLRMYQNVKKGRREHPGSLTNY